MITTLSILNSKGDQTLTWDHADPKALAEIRQTIADLKTSGYSFFLVDGTPADEAAAGAGTLIVRKLTAEELIEPVEAAESAGPTEPETTEPDTAKKRGRPRKAIAVRPMSGG